MKKLVSAVLLSTIIAAPALAFAQTSNAPVTRAEVRADLVRVEQAGYHPGANDPSYPADIQAAEAKVAAQGGSPVAQSVGGVTMSGTSQSGAAMSVSDTTSLFAHH